MKKVLFGLSVFFVFSAVVNVYAFRCNGEPVGLWDAKSQVVANCGSSYSVGYKKVYYKGHHVSAETYYYNCGANDFIYAVSFYDGVVVKEEPAGRGSGASQCGN